jgi:hypothetical protein
MDLLQQCAQEFERLLEIEYHITAGRKGKTVAFTISFARSDFHHLAGLHKLRDNAKIGRGRRECVFLDILEGKLSLAQIQRSAFYPEMEPRLIYLAHLEAFLDSNELIFRYNSKMQPFSKIEADYLLENRVEDTSVYLFLVRENQDDEEHHVCRTLFPKLKLDYTQGQPKYTLLRKEKRNLKTGEVSLQYDRLSPKG